MLPDPRRMRFSSHIYVPFQALPSHVFVMNDVSLSGLQRLNAHMLIRSLIIAPIQVLLSNYRPGL